MFVSTVLTAEMMTGMKNGFYDNEYVWNQNIAINRIVSCCFELQRTSVNLNYLTALQVII